MVTESEMYGRDALHNGEPWIVPAALDVLKTIVDPTWTVFEWGSGGSTVFWSKQCAATIAIEHNSIWIDRVTGMMAKHECPDNWELRYVRGHGIDHNTAFREYAAAILEEPDESFDLVSVDGEASSRGWCITNALPKIKPGGYLLLDNSDWFTKNLGWDKQDFVARDLKWIGQPGTFNWWTSILRKP